VLEKERETIDKRERERERASLRTKSKFLIGLSQFVVTPMGVRPDGVITNSLSGVVRYFAFGLPHYQSL
jgi:hypothetical protein